jgi:hypothetical protein
MLKATARKIIAYPSPLTCLKDVCGPHLIKSTGTEQVRINNVINPLYFVLKARPHNVPAMISHLV